MAAPVTDGTQKNYRGAGKRFYSYLDLVYQRDPTFPKIQDILNHFHLQQLDVIMREYLTVKLNATHNKGGTLRGEACGILYCLACDFGIALTTALLPSVKRICKGADNILEKWYGKRVTGKYPILRPILEDMLKHATPDEAWALLLAFEFCLRSQHYCNNKNRKLPDDFSDDDNPSPPPKKHVCTENMRLSPSIQNPNSMTISTMYDKNNPNRSYMERTVYCCCHTPWTCIVHMAQKRFLSKKYAPGAALAQCRTGDMYYSAMRCIVRDLIKKIGLNPKNYGTHSLRSGGTSELYIEGRSSIFIKNFCWWNNLNSIFIYIRPNKVKSPIMELSWF